MITAGEPGKKYSISAADYAWAVVVSDQGASVDVSGIDMEQL
jgi:hypothetical protein